MSDNISLNAGSGGATLKTDQLADLSHVQYVKLMDGTADGTGVIAIGGGLEAGALRVTLASDSTGVVSVDDNGGALTVDNGGTFAVQAAQSGTWTVQPGNTANTTAWLVTGTGGTFPITAASLPLPTGAATAAKQPALGTAGVSSADVISVQGIASGTALPVSGTFWQATQPVSLASVPSHAVTNAGVFAVQATLDAETTKVIGTVNVAAAQTIAVTNAGTFAVQAAQSGTWNVGTVTTVTAVTSITNAVVVTGGAGQIADVKITLDGESVAVTGTFWQATQPVSGTFWQATQPVSAASLPLPTGAATDATLVTIAGYIDTEIATLVTLMAGGMPAALGAGGGLKVDGSGTALPVSGTVTANAGTNLNTSALALETGGNLASAVTALQIIDDWDATDDCRSVIQTASVMDGAVKTTIKRFMVATSTDGATLIAAVVGKKFRIFSLSVIATSTTVTNFWLEDADGTDVYADSTGIPVDADGGSGPAGLVLGHNPDGWFQTATANKNLVIKLTAAQKVVVAGTYAEVD